MFNVSFIIIAAITLAGAVATMCGRNLVHCALSLVVTLAGLAALFLQLGAQFVGFAQILVYIGAVAILIVFAILLTRGADTPSPGPVATSPAWGISIAAAAFLAIASALASSRIAQQKVTPEPELTVRTIGDKLMNEYVLPLEVIGLLLTAALIGAVIIAMRDQRQKEKFNE
jgi:NADH-quinone oxidoreductase subunit J